MSHPAPTSPRPETEQLFSRQKLAERWGVSKETLKRRESSGVLHPVHLPGRRLVRYRLSEILALENAAHLA